MTKRDVSHKKETSKYSTTKRNSKRYKNIVFGMGGWGRQLFTDFCFSQGAVGSDSHKK